MHARRRLIRSARPDLSRIATLPTVTAAARPVRARFDTAEGFVLWLPVPLHPRIRHVRETATPSCHGFERRAKAQNSALVQAETRSTATRKAVRDMRVRTGRTRLNRPRPRPVERPVFPGPKRDAARSRMPHGNILISVPRTPREIGRNRWNSGPTRDSREPRVGWITQRGDGRVQRRVTCRAGALAAGHRAARPSRARARRSPSAR